MTFFAAGFASEVSEPLAVLAGTAGLALAMRASTVSVTISDDTVRVRNVLRTHTVPTASVRNVEIGPSNPWLSLSRDELTFSGEGYHVRASSCCEAWWWKEPSRSVRDAVRADIEQRTGRRLDPMWDPS